jgi:hypothetical protein
MKKVHYTKPKPNFVRTLRPVDLASLGIQSKETLVWSAGNQFCLTLNNKLSDSLAEKLPAEFRVVDIDEDDEPVEVIDPMTTIQTPQELADESEDDEIDDDESSMLDDEEE